MTATVDKAFQHTEVLPLGQDTHTEYRLVTTEGVSTVSSAGRTFLTVAHVVRIVATLHTSWRQAQGGHVDEDLRFERGNDEAVVWHKDATITRGFRCIS